MQAQISDIIYDFGVNVNNCC